jgi:hypothetical protein
MDDIEIGINVFVASARHHCFQLQLQVERQKTNVGHSYILCQHLNCKRYLINMTTTIVPCSPNIGMHGSSLKNVKATKATMMKICSFYLKDPNS